MPPATPPGPSGDAGPLANIVLLHPEIPNNTGNIGRTAAALGCRLHIVHPIGFDMGEKARRRAGLDYWHLVDCREHASWDAFVASEAPRRLWLLSARTRSGARACAHYSAPFARGDYLLFGKESTGVGPETHAWVEDTYGADHVLRIPMPGGDGIRSLNLATAVAIVGYELLRKVRLGEPASGDPA